MSSPMMMAVVEMTTRSDNCSETRGWMGWRRNASRTPTSEILLIAPHERHHPE